MIRAYPLPGSRQDKYGACSHQAKEEDDDYRMLVVHEVVAQTRAAGGDAAIGEPNIETTEERRYVEHEEPIEEAYRGVPVLLSIGWGWTTGKIT